ncbi:MAG: hypothetical protein WEF86_01080 [Gemmatimonadota bacterium]
MTIYRVLLPHPLEPRLLMLQAHGEWRLPEWEDATEHGWEHADHVNRAVSARFGMETTVLRCVSSRPDHGADRQMRVYELDNHSAPHDMVPASTWISEAELAGAQIAEPETRDLLSEWFSRERGDLPLRGAPWMRRGWYVEALAWTVARLKEVGVATVGTPDQLRAGERSFLMRVRTRSGHFYLKAAPAMFLHEPRLIQWLAQRYPGNFPEIIAVDEDRGWFLQREVGGGALPLNEVREEEEWYRAVRRLAEIQVDCTTQTNTLRDLGCPARGLEILARRIPRLCSDSAAMLLGEPCGLSRSEIDRVASLAPTLLTLCEELASYGIPDTLEHGDLWANNVLSTLGGPVYLDWSDSSLSHPFFSLSQIVTEAMILLPASSRESRRRLRDSYLLPWAGIAAPEALSRAFEIARVLAPVHLAATVHAELLPAAGYRWELECSIPGRMRRALRLIVDDDSPVDA